MSFRIHWRDHLLRVVEQYTFLEMETLGHSKRIEFALAEIASMLEANPNDVGESREGDERVLISNPLTVLYEVFADSAVVVIYSMKHHEYGSRPH